MRCIRDSDDLLEEGNKNKPVRCQNGVAHNEKRGRGTRGKKEKRRETTGEDERAEKRGRRGKKRRERRARDGRKGDPRGL